jgi:integrase/recombinase XerD
MSNAGIPLRIIQEVSGHRSLSQLQNYLEVQDSQVLGAVTVLSMLSPVGEEVRKYSYLDQSEDEASTELQDNEQPQNP